MLHPDKVIASRVLTSADEQGLDATLALIRMRHEQAASGMLLYRLSYMRAGQLVGEETFYRVPHLEQLVAFRRHSLPGSESASDGLARFARQCDISREQAAKLMPFELLEDAADQTGG